MSKSRNLGALDFNYDFLAFLGDGKRDSADLEKMAPILCIESFDCGLVRVCKETLKGLEPLRLNSMVPTLNQLFHYIA